MEGGRKRSNRLFDSVGTNTSSGVLSELTNVNDTIFDNRDMIVREIRKVGHTIPASLPPLDTCTIP